MVIRSLVNWLDPNKPKGARPWWYMVACIVLAAVLFLENIGVYSFGYSNGIKYAVGSTAVRPGIHLVSGSKPIVPQNVGLGGAVRPSALSLSEGAGSSYCGNYGGYELGDSYRNIYACGPSVGNPDPFDTVGFQCVELSGRYTWAAFRDYVYNVPDGRDFVYIANQELGIPIGSPGVHRLPLPGDVVSLWGEGAADPFGHTAVVTGVHVSKFGWGTITIMEENGSASGVDHIDVRDWVETYGDPNYGGGIGYYDHVVWLRLVNPPPPRPPKTQFPIGKWLHWNTHIPWKAGARLKVGAHFWLTHRWLGAPTNRQRWFARRSRRGIGHMQQRFKGVGRGHDKWILYWWLVPHSNPLVGKG